MARLWIFEADCGYMVGFFCILSFVFLFCASARTSGRLVRDVGEQVLSMPLGVTAAQSEIRALFGFNFETLCQGLRPLEPLVNLKLDALSSILRYSIEVGLNDVGNVKALDI